MGNLQYRKVTREVEDASFTCGVPSIDEYVKNSYYPTIVQHAYGYSISGKGIILGYYMIMFREIELDDFPPEIADYDPEIKNRKVTAVHIRYIAIDEKYQHNRIGTATIQTIIKNVSMKKWVFVKWFIIRMDRMALLFRCFWTACSKKRNLWNI